MWARFLRHLHDTAVNTFISSPLWKPRRTAMQSENKGTTQPNICQNRERVDHPRVNMKPRVCFEDEETEVPVLETCSINTLSGTAGPLALLPQALVPLSAFFTFPGCAQKVSQMQAVLQEMVSAASAGGTRIAAPSISNWSCGQFKHSCPGFQRLLVESENARRASFKHHRSKTHECQAQPKRRTAQST